MEVDESANSVSSSDLDEDDNDCSLSKSDDSIEQEAMNLLEPNCTSPRNINSDSSSKGNNEPGEESNKTNTLKSVADNSIVLTSTSPLLEAEKKKLVKHKMDVEDRTNELKDTLLSHSNLEATHCRKLSEAEVTQNSEGNSTNACISLVNSSDVNVVVVNNKSTSHVNISAPCDDMSSSLVSLNPILRKATDICSDVNSSVCTLKQTFSRTDNSTLDFASYEKLESLKCGNIILEKNMNCLGGKSIASRREESSKEINGIYRTETDDDINSAGEAWDEVNDDYSEDCVKKKALCEANSHSLNSLDIGIDNMTHTNGRSSRDEKTHENVENELIIEKNNVESSLNYNSVDVLCGQKNDNGTHNSIQNLNSAPGVECTDHIQSYNNEYSASKTCSSTSVQSGVNNFNEIRSHRVENMIAIDNGISSTDESSHHSSSSSDSTSDKVDRNSHLEKIESPNFNNESPARESGTESNPSNDKQFDTSKVVSRVVNTQPSIENTCGKLVDYGGSGSDSDSDSLESTSSLHYRDEDKATKEAIEETGRIDHSDSLKKGSINTYCENNFIASQEITRNQSNVDIESTMTERREDDEVINRETSSLESLPNEEKSSNTLSKILSNDVLKSVSDEQLIFTVESEPIADGRSINFVRTIEGMIHNIESPTNGFLHTQVLMDFLKDVDVLVYSYKVDPKRSSGILKDLETLIFNKDQLSKYIRKEETKESAEEILNKIEGLILTRDAAHAALAQTDNNEGEANASPRNEENLVSNEDLEMGVFEESDTESVDNERKDEVNDSSRASNEKTTSTPYVHESSTDTAESENEEVTYQHGTLMEEISGPTIMEKISGPITEEISGPQNTQPASGPLKRKQNMDSVNKVPPAKKRGLSKRRQPLCPLSKKKASSSLLPSNSSTPQLLLNMASMPNQDSLLSFLPQLTNSVDPNNVQLSNNVEPSKSVTRKVFLCASCNIYFESWNLYLHMLERHKRYICLLCLGMFVNCNILHTHLRSHHNLPINHLASSKSKAYMAATSNDYILTCVSCGHLVENNNLVGHTCSPKPVGLNSSHNSSPGSNSSPGGYLDPESLMLATMTEGEHHLQKTKTVEVVSLDDGSTKEVVEVQVGSPLREAASSPLGDKQINPDEAKDEGTSPSTNACTILEDSAEKSERHSPQEQHQTNDGQLTDTTDAVVEKPGAPIVNITTMPATPPKSPSPEPDETSPVASSHTAHADRLPPVSSPGQPSASNALSELERCHKLLIAERSSDDESASDLEECQSLVDSVSMTPEKLKEDLAEKTETSEDNLKASSSHELDLQSDVDRTKRDIDPKVVMDQLDECPLSSTPDKSNNDEHEAPTLCEKSDEDKDATVHSAQSIASDYLPSVPSFPLQSHDNGSDLHDSPKVVDSVSKEKVTEFPALSDDDNNQDFNDSDNENSLKIDDSVFEDEEDVSEAKDVAGSSKPLDTVVEEKSDASSSAFKINPLRIKIKCGNSGDNQYERVKTETEIRERAARERRYDDAIDDVIRKSIMEFESKAAEREQKEREREEKRREKEAREKERVQREMERKQKEKEEYERLQAELVKKQEEYQRIQEAYMSMHANEDDDKENESTELDESMEEASEGRNERVDTEYDDRVREVRRESEERVKLIERNQDEKSSLLKEELLKKCEKLFADVDQPDDEPEAECPGVLLASEDIQPMALSLEDKLENVDIRVVLKECVRTSCTVCVYCYHATRIVVNAKHLALHILAEHRYTPVKNDSSDDLIQFIKANLSSLETESFSSDTFDPTDKTAFVPFDNVYHCLQCGFSSKHQRELTSHKRKMHSKTSQICLLCKQILLNQSELLFHYCAGVENTSPADNVYWCGVCGLDKLPSAFRLMVHLRKKHNTCNVCLEQCSNEGKLLQHMLKHKIIHMCYKCNISYRNKQDITKHLFWKHGTESIVCKKCLQKRWSHVYHFCQPPARFTCEECNLTFKSSSTLKVHKRLHAGMFPYACSEENCEEKFISRKLLNKHIQWHQAPAALATPPPQDKSDASAEPHIDVCNVDETESPGAELKASSKSKKKKKGKFDLNSLNLVPLNLSSESDSSDDDDSSKAHSVSGEDSKAEPSINAEPKGAETSEVKPVPSDVPPSDGKPTEEAKDNEETIENPPEAHSSSTMNMPDLSLEADPQPSLSKPPTAAVEEPPPSSQDIVPDVWDQFKSFTNSLNVFRHVDAEHDYHVVYPREEEKPVEAPQDKLDMEVNAEKNEQESEAHNKTANTTLNKSTSDDSSSDSSSSSSCGSRCGSNCSCSSSSSSSSSSSDDSSSDSDSSDPEARRRQEEKRQAKKLKKRMKKHSHTSELNVTIENEAAPPVTSPPPEENHQVHSVIPAPPPIAESDLETDVTSSDEDFYDEKPQIGAPAKVEEKFPSQPTPTHHESPSPRSPQHPPPVASHNYPSPSVSQAYQPVQALPPVTLTVTPNRAPKKRKRPRMRNVPTSTPKNVSSFKTSFKHPFMKPSPAFENKKTPVALIASVETSPTDYLTDDNTRSSKRKRKQNRFYGYSDDEEPGEFDHDESDEFSTVKQPPFKKKLLWKPLFDEKIPLPTASPPPYENKIRIENPFKVKSTPEYNYGGSTTPGYGTSEPEQPEDSSSDEDPTIAAYNKLSALPPPPIVSEPPAPSSVPLYCYCRCPYDEVSEMIACDGDDCEIEWYHFECVNILVPPKGKWYCPQCRPKYQPF